MSLYNLFRWAMDLQADFTIVSTCRAMETNNAISSQPGDEYSIETIFGRMSRGVKYLSLL